jgi:hypothetical protein
MGSTVKNSVNPRLANFQLPSVELLKSLFYWREFGSPDYQWYIQFSTKPLPRRSSFVLVRNRFISDKVADPVETAKHRFIVEKKRLLRRLLMSYEGVRNTLGQLTALDRNEMFLVELENFQNAIVERIDNLTLESPKAPRKK